MFPLLPKLSPNHSVPPPTPGSWRDSTADELQNVADGLDSAAVDVEVSSIPDVWARPMLFEAALFDWRHILHRQVVGEWRGLLATIALAEVRAFPVTVETCSLLGSPVAGKELASVLENLKPLHCNVAAANWTEFCIFKYGGEVVGMTSPSTIVCTRFPLPGPSLPMLDWVRGSSFQDPCQFLNPDEKDSLSGWLRNLAHSLAAHRTDRSNVLLGLLERNNAGDGFGPGFINDLGGGGQTTTLSTRALGVGLPAFALLDKSIAKAGGGSESFIRILPERSDVQPDLLLVEEIVAQQMRLTPQNVRAWGNTALAVALRGLNPARRDMIGTTQLTNAVWCKSEDIFTSKALIFENAAALDKAITVDGSRSVQLAGRNACACAPIRAEILRYFSPAALAKRLSLAWEKDRLIARLSLDVSGPTGQPVTITLEKIYSKDQMETVLPAPHTQYWPYFRSSGWKQYYVFSKPAKSRTGGWIRGVPFAVTSVTGLPLGDTSDALVYQLDQPPEAVLFQNNQGDELGAALLDPPPKRTSRADHWRVGVDFGTSSTAVAIQVDMHSNPISADFEQSLVRVITDPGNERLLDLAHNFVPEETLTAPFFSIFRSRLSRADKATGSLSKGNIQFICEQSAELKVNDTTLKKNLKWGGSEEREPARLFLEQLILQICARAVVHGAEEVTWFHSYPTAFSGIERETYEGIWRQLLEQTQKLTGIRAILGSRDTESVCTAKYFRHFLNAAPAAGMVSIDIGGGTSDIAIWQGSSDRMVLQTSLRLAGRDLFLEPLRHMPTVLNFLGASGSAPETSAHVSPVEFYTQADLILSMKSAELLSALQTKGSNPSVERLLSTTALGIAGIFFYSGLLVAYLCRHSRYDLTVVPDFYFGGNGSKLFHWVATGSWTNTKAVNEVFRKVFQEAVQFGLQDLKSPDTQPIAGSITIKLSKNAKLEVASGLLRVTEGKEAEQVEAETIAGEEFTDNAGKPGHWHDLLNAESLSRGIKVVELPNLKRLIETFNAANKPSVTGLTPIPLEPVLLDRTRNHIIQALDESRGRDAGEVHVEPMFVTGLKAYLSELAQFGQ